MYDVYYVHVYVLSHSSGLQSNVVGTASSWAGWAYSSLASKLSKAPETCSVYPAAQG